MSTETMPAAMEVLSPKDWAERPGEAAVAASGDSASAAGAGQAVLAAMRERLADDLDSPGAIAVLDHWAAAVQAGEAAGSGRQVRDAIDALLGLQL